MSAADRKRLMVLRNLGDVYGTPSGPRLYTSSSSSSSVRAEIHQLEAWHMVERYVDGDGESRYRITNAGRAERARLEAEA
jgi:hypothetical protein